MNEIVQIWPLIIVAAAGVFMFWLLWIERP